MSPKKLVQLEETVRKSVARLQQGNFIAVAEKRPSASGGQMENLYQVTSNA